MSDSQTPSMTPAEYVQKMAAESAARIKQAEDDAHAGMVALAAGKFEEFWQQRFEQSRKAILDEYDRIFQSNSESTAAGGDGQEGG